MPDKHSSKFCKGASLSVEPQLCCSWYHRGGWAERLKEESVWEKWALTAPTLYAGDKAPPSQMPDSTNPFWEGVLQRRNNGHISFSPCTAFGLAAAAPTDTCFLWQGCAAQPRQRTTGCPRRTHGLRTQGHRDTKTKTKYQCYKSCCRFLSCIQRRHSPTATHWSWTWHVIKRSSYQATGASHHLKKPLCPGKKALL